MIRVPGRILERELMGRGLRSLGLALAAALFLLLLTLIMAGDTLLPGWSAFDRLRIGQVAEQNILAPFTITFESDVLTALNREEAAQQVSLVYDPPDPNVGRAQSQLARQILDYIGAVRRDNLGNRQQRAADLQQITALTLGEEQIQQILDMSSEAWESVDGEIITVLERMMRESIRDNELEVARTQLPTQVSIRFSASESGIIVAIVEDLLRPNTFANGEATGAARQAAIAEVAAVERTFVLNEVVVRQNEPLDAVDMEALQKLGLLTTDSRRLQEAGRALFAGLLVLSLSLLFLARFERRLLADTRFLLLLAAVFLLLLAGARVAQPGSGPGQPYLFPTAALGLLFVAIASPRVAMAATINMAFLLGLLTTGSLEMASLAAAGGLTGVLTLRKTDRLNHFFLSGLLIALANMLVAVVFNLGVSGASLTVLLPYSLFNGLLAAAIAIAGMYILTLLFNLPTSLKLTELSQPGHPLLQRLLREAPGTYQHSLQVANLGEQAALAIGADAEQLRVAAMYHDVGKLRNAIFFSENQQFGAGNAHDTLDDPARSAEIITHHVSDGIGLAREYHLPRRFHEYIREHHGTTCVYFFWCKALESAGGDEGALDHTCYHYPGPRPRSRETAILMLADSCESAVRSIGPTSRRQVREIIMGIVEQRMNDGQLDESGLTLNDIRAIQRKLVEILQALYHPRIDYRRVASRSAASIPVSAPDAEGEYSMTVAEDSAVPLADVPPLPAAGENGRNAERKQVADLGLHDPAE